MTCHLLPFIADLDQPHLLSDLVVFSLSLADSGIMAPVGAASSPLPMTPDSSCWADCPVNLLCHLPPGFTTSPSTPTATTTTTFLMATVTRAHKGLKMMMFV